ncbi:prevent-host-death protein [Paraburkholderia jirisanensis]
MPPLQSQLRRYPWQTFSQTRRSTSANSINSTSVIEAADGPVAVLNGGKPIAYLVPATEWEAICNALEDCELAKIVEERAGEETVIVDLDDLSRTRHRF